VFVAKGLRMTKDQIITLAIAKYTKKKVEDSGFEIVVPVWISENSSHTSLDVQDFLKKFFDGYNNRPSQRTSGEMKSVSDPLIDELIEERIDGFDKRHVRLTRFAHRLSMGAENIIGAMLEEYIHSKVLKYGWATCWGSSIKAVDLCSRNGSLVQIKNKSNTENSSSSKIRTGTTIKKWYRLSASNGKTKWPELNTMLGIPAYDALSETDFHAFARNVVKDNPGCLYVDTFEYGLVSPLIIR